MPKISALPAMTSADGADPAPIVDDSATQTKKITLTKMKEWLQSLTGWITASMIAGLDKSLLTTDSNPYKFRAYKNQAQNSAGSGTFGKLNANGENWDTNNNYDNATNYRYTAPVAGFYCFFGGARTDNGSSAGLCIAAIRKNGTDTAQGTQYGNANGFGRPIVFDFVQMAAGDYVELWVRWDIAASSIASGTAESYFGGYLVSRT